MYNKKENIILLIIILIISFSCNEPQSILEINCKEINLRHELVNIDNNKLFKIEKMVLVDSILFVLNETENNYFSVFNTNTNSLMFQFGKKGKGPGEIKWPLYINYCQNTNALEVNAIQPKGSIQYNIDSLVHYNGNYDPNVMNINVEEMYFSNLKSFGDSLYIGNVESPDGQFAILDKNRKLISVQGRYPVDDGVIEKNQIILARAYKGELKTHPELPKFVYTSGLGSIIEICELDENMLIRKLNSYCFKHPRYTKDGVRVAKTRDNIIGYNSLYSTKEYIYALYSDANLMDFLADTHLFNTILVFDWSGNLVRKYKTDIKLRYITVSNDNSVIYGTAANPEPQIIKFKL